MKPRFAALLRSFAGIWIPDWPNHSARTALRVVPVIVLCLAAGVAVGSPGAGVIAAGGALGAGFGAFERIRGSSLLPMLFACVGNGLSVFAGTLFGYSDFGFTLLAAVASLCAGLVFSVSPGLWYVGLQFTIAAMIAASYPEDFASAASRTTLVVCGGLVQTLFVLLIRRLRPLKDSRRDEDRLDTEKSLRAILAATAVLPAMKRRLAPTNEVWREAIRLALTVGFAAWLSRFLGIHHSYWAPMTALLILKGDLRLTFGRGVARVAGTLAGVTLATLVSVTLHPGVIGLCLLSAASACALFTLLRVNYALYSIFIAAFVVFQLEILGETGTAVAKDRVLGTLLGVACAIVTHLTRLGAKTRV